VFLSFFRKKEKNHFRLANRLLLLSLGDDIFSATNTSINACDDNNYTFVGDNWQLA